MTALQSVIIYGVYPLCTIGLAGIVTIGIRRFAALEHKIDNLYGKMSRIEVDVKTRLAVVETKLDD